MSGSNPQREPIALRQVLRFVTRTRFPTAGSAGPAPALFDFVSLKRPEVIVRRTEYFGMMVDERLLTSVFAWVPRAPTLQVFLLLEGRLTLEARDGSERIQMRPGEPVLLSPSDASLARYENMKMLDVEWAPEGDLSVGPPLTRLREVDPARVLELAHRLKAGEGSDRELLADAFQLLRDAGAPLALDVQRFADGPSEQDLRIARAIAAQVAQLPTASSALTFGEHAELSPRQIQRILASFCERYRMNATSWRDMRNRYRLQIAMGLASIPGISVATIAAEVGYASPTALARAFSDAGLPSPREYREKLAAINDRGPSSVALRART